MNYNLTITGLTLTRRSELRVEVLSLICAYPILSIFVANSNYFLYFYS